MTIDPKLIDVVLPFESGYSPALAAEDTRDVLWDCCGAASRDFPEALWIEPSDWADVAAENDRLGLWPVDYLDRYTNQYNTHECTTHALRACAESCRNRQRRIKLGPPVAGQRLPISAQAPSVWLSCLSIYAEANPRIRGGANVRQVLEIAVRRGFIPDKTQPRDWGFKHTLTGTNGKGNGNQSGGAWVKVADFPDGWQETAKHFRPLEVIFPESWEQTVCLVLNGIAVGVGRSGHSIPYTKWMAADRVMAYTDSYDVTRYDSVSNIKRTVGGSYAIASFTTPDDWSKPAG